MTFGTTGTSRALVVLTAIGLLAASSAPVCAQQAAGSPSVSDTLAVRTDHLIPLEDDGLLVLELRLEKETSGHGLLAYQSGDHVMLPLGAVAAILELAVTVDAGAGLAEGWIVTEERTFVLDLDAATLTLEGAVLPLPPSSVASDGSDLYLREDLLQDWLPVDVQVNHARMNVTLTPRELLPYQDRRQREEQRERWLATHGRAELAYPLWVAPYRMWTWPMTDATYSYNTSEQGTTRRLTSQSWWDVAGLSSNLFLTHWSRDEVSRTNARLKVGRWDREGGLLGGVGATSYEFGDLDIGRVPMISATKRGLGLTVSNRDLNRSREFDTTLIHGDAPPGWEAELYINGSLYDFQTVTEEGRYSFPDVPLVVGNNTFRTVLYGPRGEKRTVINHANISPEMTDVGELKYKATLIREGDGVLTDPNSGGDSEARPWNHQLGLSYAFSNHHAMELDFSSLSFLGHRDLYTSLTSQNSLGRVHTENILAVSTDGGVAGSLGARTNYEGHNIFALTSLNDSYRAESPDGVQYTHRRTQLRASGGLFRRASRSLTYGLSLSDRSYRGGSLRQERDHQARISGNVGKLMLSHSLRSHLRRTETEERHEILGSHLMRTWYGPFSVRADLTYEVGPGRIRSMSATGTYYEGQHLQATLRLSHHFNDQYGLDAAKLEVTRLFDRFTIGANVQLREELGPTFGLTLGTFLARDHRSNTWSSTHRRMANRTAASVRTFVDLDNDGLYDGDDQPLAGVRFRNHTAWRDLATNTNGIALLPGVLPHQTQTIEMDLSSVDDPYLMPVSKGANVVGHPGGIVDVDLPFAYAGEIEGRVIDAALPDVPLRHVGLELLDRNGERAGGAVSEFDGYYYIADILPGVYELRVIASTVPLRRYYLPDPATVVVPGRGGYVQGPDIIFERREPLAPPPTVATAGVPVTVTEAAADSTAAQETPLPPADEAAPPPVVGASEPTPPELDPAKVQEAYEILRMKLRLPRDRNCTGK